MPSTTNKPRVNFTLVIASRGIGCTVHLCWLLVVVGSVMVITLTLQSLIERSKLLLFTLDAVAPSAPTAAKACELLWHLSVSVGCQAVPSQCHVERAVLY